jgi:tetratricopeptide (TPR) repeat protein
MSEFAGKEFLDQATQSLQGGQFEQALEFAQNALAHAPDSAEAYVLIGIAQSQLSRPHEAVESFQKAIELDPKSPKAHYNLAVHYYGLGQKSDALAAAGKAVECDPSHSGAKDFVQRLESELNIAPRTVPDAAGGEVPPAPTAFAPPPPGGAYRQGYDSPVHSLRWVENMGRTWDIIGWALTIVSVLLTFTVLAVTFPTIMKFWNEAMSNPGAAKAMKPPDFGTAMRLFEFLGYAFRLAMMGWMIVEIIDRRSPWLWILPYVLCCCCGMQGLVNGIYLLAGRPKK